MAQLSNSVERFADVAEICSEFKTSEEALQMLRRFEHASGELDLIAPCLSLLVGRGWKDVDSEVLRLCNRLANHRGSVFVRRTALQTLSKLVRREEDSGWRQFFVIMDALEHSQFHLAAPSLPLIDILLSRCTDETRKATELSWYWVRLVFQRGLEHCKGWIRFWTARKFLSVQPAIMANDFSAIFELLLPIMSEYDIYWRMDREGCFDDFLSSLISFLTCCVRPLDNTTLARFCQSVLEFLITVKEPSAMIFLSQTFSKLPHVDALELDDDGMFRKLLSSTESLREPQFKPVISANLFKLYINMLKWSESTIWTVASIVRYPYESIFRDLLYSEGFQNYWDSFVTLLSPNISAFELIDLYLEKAKSTQFGYFSTAVVASRLSCILNLEESVASEISDRLTQMWTQGEHKRVEFALLIQLTASVQQKALVVRKANDVFTEYLDIFCESAEGNVDEFRLFNNALKSQMKLLSAENHRWLMKALNILQTDVSPCRRSLLLLIALSDSMRNYSCKGCSHISSVKRYFDQCLPQLVPNPTLSKNSDDHVFVEDAGISIDDEVVSCNFLLLKKFADALFLDWDFLFEECLIAMEKQSAVKSILAIVALMTDIIVKAYPARIAT
ncbi:hypothetical protein AB6A40_000961 [Gnathostoma spinigerum]|uniref:Uncharacterized protein n=1 Tax=Gnathostoma spinigerum TaxID=75299 RepID=A0ABD6EC33_9BILA